MLIRFVLVVGFGTLFFADAARAEDWPMPGRDRTRNTVSPEKNPPTDWQVEIRDAASGQVTTRARNIKWSAELGSRSMGSPVVADGLVWIGTNNGQPRDPKRKEDASVLMCFRESDGKFLWQYFSPRLRGTDMIEDWPHHSMGSPLVEGDRLWLITNRGEALCLDIGPLKKGTGEPREVWRVDMRKEFGVSVNSIGMAGGFAPSPAVYKDWLYMVTSNGVGEDHIKVPAPEAPALICFDKRTGKVVWQDNSPGKRILDAQRSSPLVIEANGRGQVLMGQGDGWLRSFDPATGKLLWKCDLNRKDARYDLGGRGTRNYVMATPVYAEERVYIAPGQDPEHYEGEGFLHCIDPTRQGDISLEVETAPEKGKPNPNNGVIWRVGGAVKKEDLAKVGRDYYFGRSQSDCTVVDGLVYAPELAGYLHCFDAKSGKAYWVHDVKSSCWTSALWVDGKVYLPTEDGDVWIFKHGKEKAEPKKIEMERPIRAAPVFANGVLYIATESRLYAIQEKK
jgi:outer membrane protein assembly factor BamB